MLRTPPNMIKRDNNSCNVATLCAIAVLLAMLLRVAYFYFTPDQTLVSTIPDDAFYYIQMARHRAFDQIWSFDGTRPTTGFHFLYAYLLVAIFKLLGDLDWRSLYALIGTLASVFIASAAWLNVQSSLRLFGRSAPWVAAVPFLTPLALMQGNAMMESWLVLFFSAGGIYLLSRQTRHPHWQFAFLFATGILGSLSRSDFGMLAGMAMVCWALLGRKDTPNKTKEHLYLLLGAVAGIGVVFVHNHMIAQQFSQASAQTKYHWSSLSGHQLGPSLKLALDTIVPYYEALPKLGRALVRIALPLLFIASLFRLYQNPPRSSPNPLILPLAAACGMTLIGYIAFYRYNCEALQNWYCANLLAPAGIILSAIMKSASSRICRRLMTTVWLSCVVSGMGHILSVPYRHAAGMMEAGLLIKRLDIAETYGAWNGGIISYFSGKPVVNIDGLANDEILPFIQRNQLIDYLKSRKIGTIIDYHGMLDNKILQRRGGYLPEPVGPCLAPVELIPTTPHNTGEYQMERIQIVPRCRPGLLRP